MTYAEYQKINFQLPQGTPLKQSFIKTSNSNNPVVDTVINPSVVVYGWIPTKGDGNTLNAGTQFAAKATGSPINVAGLKFYNKLRSANSSLSAYSPADVLKCVIAMDSLYGLLAEEEVDIICLVDSRYDTYAHRGLLRKALWSNPDNATKDISNYISRHNAQCKKAEAFPFIPGVPFLKDHLDWASEIYKDDNIDKSGIFLFRRSAFYYWEVKSTDPDPGFLMLRDADLSTYSYATIDVPFTAEQRFDIVDFLIDSYLIDDDIANICSEIYKAYGKMANEYHINQLPADVSNMMLNEKYDLDMIDAVKNADFYQLQASNVNIYGINENSNGDLVYAVGSASNVQDVFPVYAVDTDGTNWTIPDTGASRILYSYEANPTNEAIRVMTRFTHNYKQVSSSIAYVYGLRTEFLTGIRILWYDPTQINPIQDTIFYKFIDQYAVSITDMMRRLTPLIALPCIYQVVITNHQYTGVYYPYRKDIDNMGLYDNNAMLLYAELEMCHSFSASGTNKKSDNKA